MLKNTAKKTPVEPLGADWAGGSFRAATKGYTGCSAAHAAALTAPFCPASASAEAFAFLPASAVRLQAACCPTAALTPSPACSHSAQLGTLGL